VDLLVELPLGSTGGISREICGKPWSFDAGDIRKPWAFLAFVKKCWAFLGL